MQKKLLPLLLGLLLVISLIGYAPRIGVFANLAPNVVQSNVSTELSCSAPPNCTESLSFGIPVKAGDPIVLGVVETLSSSPKTTPFLSIVDSLLSTYTLEVSSSTPSGDTTAFIFVAVPAVSGSDKVNVLDLIPRVAAYTTDLFIVETTGVTTSGLQVTHNNGACVDYTPLCVFSSCCLTFSPGAFVFGLAGVFDQSSQFSTVSSGFAAMGALPSHSFAVYALPGVTSPTDIALGTDDHNVVEWVDIGIALTPGTGSIGVPEFPVAALAVVGIAIPLIIVLRAKFLRADGSLLDLPATNGSALAS